MADVYVDQPIRLILETYGDLAGVTEAKILYKKPDRTTGEWIATISGTTVFYDVVGDTLTAGRWYFQASVQYTGFAYPVIGSRATQYVSNNFDRAVV